MYALRLARAYTGKYKIVKFEGQYHGWSDEEKVSIDASCVEELGDRENPRKILHTKGQRLSSAEDLIVLPWNDLPALERTLAARGGEIAAVLMEPCMCDSGPILPKPGYLEGVREVTRKYGVLLIFDEVITGFRLALGGAQAYYGVTPDLSTFAKAIASGYPFGAVVGRREVMACGVPASGTFNGNPIGVAAALATIETLSQPGVYAHLEGLAQQLETGFRALARKYHRPLYLRHVGSIFILYFGFAEDVEDFRDWLTQADLASYTRFVAGSMASGSPTDGAGNTCQWPTPRRISGVPWLWRTRCWGRWNEESADPPGKPGRDGFENERAYWEGKERACHGHENQHSVSGKDGVSQVSPGGLEG